MQKGNSHAGASLFSAMTAYYTDPQIAGDALRQAGLKRQLETRLAPASREFKDAIERRDDERLRMLGRQVGMTAEEVAATIVDSHEYESFC